MDFHAKTAPGAFDSEATGDGVPAPATGGAAGGAGDRVWAGIFARAGRFLPGLFVFSAYMPGSGQVARLRPPEDEID